jgi:hypothetical protein
MDVEWRNGYEILRGKASEKKNALARIMHEGIKREGLLCEKWFDEAALIALEKSFVCLILPRHSVCCSAICTSIP